MSRRTRVKICCIANRDEAELAVSMGVDVLGLVSAMPSGPGPIDEATIADVARATPPGVASFLLSCLDTADGLIEQHCRCRTTAIQIVDELPKEAYAKLRAAMLGVGLVQVIHVRNELSIDEAAGVAEFVDAILLDSGNPTLAVKELGGTGRVHDWALSRRIVESVPKPVYLAGGLNPDNVGRAIGTVRPFGVDICSGVRTAGRLDPAKLEAFVAAVRVADAGRAA